MDWLKACVQESGQTLYNREKKEWDYTNETKEPAKEAEKSKPLKKGKCSAFDTCLLTLQSSDIKLDLILNGLKFTE